MLQATGREFAPPADEVFMVGFGGAVFSRFVLSVLDAGLRLHWLSPLARRVAFVLLPPLMLIFLVLGTVYLGVATPTEAGALGAIGAVMLALARRRLTRRNAASGRSAHPRHGLVGPVAWRFGLGGCVFEVRTAD
jgi:TRAP-type mannitol/chloroaromatic compound transport system permease large subunit